MIYVVFYLHNIYKQSVWYEEFDVWNLTSNLVSEEKDILSEWNKLNWPMISFLDLDIPNGLQS